MEKFFKSSIYLVVKIITCHNNSEKSSTEKKVIHKSSGHSMFKQCSFDTRETSLIVTEVKIVWKSFVKA